MVLVHPHEYLFFSFKVIVIGLDLSVIDPCAFFFTSTMSELYSFENLVVVIQKEKPQKKHLKRRLMKVALKSQGDGSS